MVVSIHRGLGFLFLTLGLVMFFLAGLGSFGEPDGFDVHSAIGSGMTVIALVLVILAAVGRREALPASGALLLLMLVQTVLAVVGREGASIIGALHPVNALLILFVAHQTARGLPLPLGGPTVNAPR
jgi:hypothetical protein